VSPDVSDMETRDVTLRQARAQYFRENSIENDGGYADKCVKIKLGPLPIRFPNTSGRQAAWLQHALHHVATGRANGQRTATTTRPRYFRMTSPDALRAALVEQLRSKGCLQSPSIADAFSTVPRHLFVPDVSVEEAYRDHWIATKRLPDGAR
jgi:hypothetical protein